MRQETGQAVLDATGCLTPQLTGPPLSALVQRIAVSRSRHSPAVRAELALASANARDLLRQRAEPAPMGPPRGQEVPRRGRAASLQVPSRISLGVAILGAHGGAGVSCLLRAGLAGGGGVDAAGLWPADGPVLIVARTSTWGLQRAQELAREHAAGAAGYSCQLVGLVLVADARGRLPRRVHDLADLVCGGFGRVWQLPWIEEWRLAASAEPLPTHPELARLMFDLRSDAHAVQRRASSTHDARDTAPLPPERGERL